MATAYVLLSTVMVTSDLITSFFTHGLLSFVLLISLIYHDDVSNSLHKYWQNVGP
jgi:hypothetical protein